MEKCYDVRLGKADGQTIYEWFANGLDVTFDDSELILVDAVPGGPGPAANGLTCVRAEQVMDWPGARLSPLVARVEEVSGQTSRTLIRSTETTPSA